ncbi:uncharacterized protein isoform X2 [Rhodnius prolixus]|uniref:uncharacterized protein isoform X2 n=1 Tax=Rhodnius prolixus TaxID=13249 RepID=UPI003D18C1E3
MSSPFAACQFYNCQDPQASFDVNSHDDNPMPRYDMIDSNRHGTRCAGEVAAVANNTICSVGIAYKASVGGVRMLDGDVTDAVEARSLSFNPQHIDIYSASWGPDDDGKTVDGPGELAMRAFIEGVTKGRGGKGSIFVWASGNGGRDHDNCNCDGYTNSIWTLSISSATENGLVPWYSEACSSTLATTYSSGSTGEKQIVTTDLHHQCTSTHTGTSASAPLAAGICALALEANTQLTWRDMQHIVVATAKPANLRAPDWTTNGVGRNVSHSFGYGLMDAAAMVQLARNWPTVPQQHKCEVSAPHIDKVIPAKSHVSLSLNVKECAGVNYLEHVQAKISLLSQRRGDIEIQLTSPAGTKTTLLARRPHDISRSGFRSWPFMSVHTWGENPIGVWTLEIHNEARFLGRATLQEWALIFYGTEMPPPSYNSAYIPPVIPQRPAYPVNLPPQPKKNKGSRKNKAGSGPTVKPGKSSKNKNGQNSGASVAATVLAPTVVRKTPRPSVISARRPTAPPPPLVTHYVPTHPVGLTILLAPPQQPSQTTDHFPAIFQQYSKVQQLFPYSKINESPLRPSRKGLEQSDLQKESAQLSDWNLIFYGTETAPGTDLDGFSSSKKKGDVLASPVSGPVDNNVETSRGFTGQGSPVSSGSGEDSSPPGWPDLAQRTSSQQSLEGLGIGHGDMDLVPISSTACRVTSRACLECSQGYYLWQGHCEAKCPPGTYATESICTSCHYSCEHCTGTNDYECTQCYPDAEFYNVSSFESYCYPKSILPWLNYTKWYYRTCFGLVINGILLSFVGILFYFRRGCSFNKKKDHLQPTIINSVRYKLAQNESDSEN